MEDVNGGDGGAPGPKDGIAVLGCVEDVGGWGVEAEVEIGQLMTWVAGFQCM